jgi:hypothetical protein
MLYNNIIGSDLIDLSKAYLKDNKIKVRISSVYRSIDAQLKLRNYYVKTGQKSFATPAGTSEHQL